MKLLFTSQGTDWDSAMDPRFGRTQYFFVYNEETEEVETFNNSAIQDEAHGAGPLTAQKLAEYKAQVLITGNGPGGNAARILATAGTEVFVGAGELTVREALAAYRNGTLEKVSLV